MTTEKVFSTINYDGKDAQNATFWKDCYHQEEVSMEDLKEKQWYVYRVKFDGLKPIQITKKTKI